ncbi:MAG TPA: Rieske 2Fe-2S domain-containing protein [Chloroflexota bacterium]
MRITFLGQAGLFVETSKGTILCDPWFNPAYFASWFPFPSNEDIDVNLISNPTYLYISHLHHDHFDPHFLRDHVSKDAVVLLPEYPLEHLELELKKLGFTSFVHTRANEPFEHGGLRLMIMPLTAPTDGPIGDSGLVVDDGEVRIFNQNDSRPIELDHLQAFGPLDAHFLQFSGAIWFPMVYNFHPKVKDAQGRKKRQTEMARALRYVTQVGASHVFPSAGPPCFLDDDLFYFNDFDRNPANTFPDQTVFLEYLEEHGVHGGHLVLPGSTITLKGGRCDVEHALPDDEVHKIFTEKRGYLEAYQERQRARIHAEKATWPCGQVDILPALQTWWEPLLQQADLTCAGVNGRVLLEAGDEHILVDFLERRVYRYDGEHYRYRFHMDRSLVESCILRHEEDWVNELFLSCRFEAEREGPYNEYVYNFFKGLSPERLQYAEGYYAEQSPVQELWRCGDYYIQKRCPHLKADLERFAEVDRGVLTCTMHGWQFDLATGRCLTSDDRRLYTKPVAEVEAETSATSPAPAVSAE